MPILLDPPVTALSSVAELEAWRRELAALRARHADDPAARATIGHADEEARGWLEDARAVAAGLIGGG
jgi:hypothetical protein